MKSHSGRASGEAGPTAKRSARRFWLRLLGGLLVAGVVLQLSAWFASEVFEGETLVFDTRVRETIHQSAFPTLTSAMIGLSFIGAPAFLLGLGCVVLAVLILLKWKREAWLFAITMAGAAALDIGLKGAYARIRPEPYFDYVLPSSYSFPSGHALGSFAFFGIIAWLISARVDNAVAAWCIRLTAALLILLIGVSRVYLGVHYPTDVLAGYLAALIWVTSVILAESYFEKI